MDPNDDQVIYLAFSGFGTDHAYKTIDGGDSWFSIGEGLLLIGIAILTISYHAWISARRSPVISIGHQEQLSKSPMVSSPTSRLGSAAFQFL